MDVRDIQENNSILGEFAYLSKVPAIYYVDTDEWMNSVLQTTFYVKCYGMLNKMLKVTPPHGVPLELGLIYFLLVNSYKSTYVIHTMSELQRYLFTMPVVILVFLQTPEQLDVYSLHFWNVLVVLMISCLTLRSRIFTSSAVSFLICASQPVHFLVDLIFCLCLVEECRKKLPQKHFKLVLAYSTFGLVLHYFAYLFMMSYGLSEEIVYLKAIFALITAFFLMSPMDGKYMLKFHIVYAVFFPTLVNFLSETLLKDERLTYSLPDFKSL